MLVTHTGRERVPFFPRFRIMAMSMEHWQICIARISAVPIGVIHFDPVVMLEEQTTTPTATLLRFKQPGQPRTGIRMASLSATPVHPVPIVRAAIALHLDMPFDLHFTRVVKVDGVSAGGRRGKGATGADPMPVSLENPSDGLARMPSMCPVAEFDPD